MICFRGARKFSVKPELETFCHVDEKSKIVIFTTKSNLEYLVNKNYTILGDDIFYVCPIHFEQLYTIHALPDARPDN